MDRNRANDIGPWEFRVVLGARLRNALIIGGSVAGAWTAVSIVLQVIAIVR